MKKILTVSLVAIMAVGAAHANIASTEWVEQHQDAQTSALQTEIAKKVDTTTYEAHLQAQSATNTQLANDIASKVAQTEYDAKMLEIETDLGKVATNENFEALQDDVEALQTSLTDTGATGSRIVALETADTTMSGQISGLGTRLGTAEGTISSQGTRLTTAESTISSQGTEITGLDTRLTTAEGEIDDLQSADAAFDAKIGAVTEGKTVVEMIADAQSAATYDDAEVRGLISAEEAARKAADGDLTTLATEVKTSLVGAINEVDAHADEAAAAAADAQSAADAAQEDADANALAIGSYDAVTGQGSGLAKSVADNAAAAAAAQEKADLAIPNLSATGTDGVYTLTAVVAGDTTTYKWELITRATTPAEPAGL